MRCVVIVLDDRADDRADDRVGEPHRQPEEICGVRPAEVFRLCQQTAAHHVDAMVLTDRVSLRYAAPRTLSATWRRW